MDKHIELVKKWLDDPESVTTKELLANSHSADAAAYAYAAGVAVKSAAKHVKKYEELMGEWDE